MSDKHKTKEGRKKEQPTRFSQYNFSSKRRSILKVVGGAGALGVFAGPASADENDTDDADGGFSLIEATIVEIHEAMSSGGMTAQGLVEQYLARIEEYDDELNSILTLNENAAERAQQLDEKLAQCGFVGPLHGIPIILKDNFDTGDLPTTAASVSLEGSIPPDDAFLVNRLRRAGGIILAKANLHEYALGGATVSSLGGQTHNPYDLERVPGGSSGGPAAAIAANLGAIGMGTDTVGSVRGPAAFNALVGIRPTIGLLSRDGIIPISSTQDTGGPMTRTVTDLAVTMDTITGYDPSDPVTARSVGELPRSKNKSYTDYLNLDGLEGVRLGFIRDYSGANEAVTEVIETAIDEMTKLGAEVIDPVPAPPDDIAVTVHPYEFNRELNEYLATLSDEYPKTLETIVETGQYLKGLEDIKVRENVDQDNLDENATYLNGLRLMEKAEEIVLATMADHDLDALIFPTTDSIPAKIENREIVPAGPETTDLDEENVGNLLDSGDARHLSPSTGFPALSMPAGFTADSELPVGIEFLARPFEEPELIEMAYSYEQGTEKRHPPEGFGPLT